MSQGWIKLHRKLLDSRVFSNEGLLKVWVYCLCRANHEQNFVPIKTGKGNTEVEVNEGEFIYGRNSCSKDLRMNPSTLHKRMKKLESIGNLIMQSNSHYSIVSICNWSTYQDSEKEKEQAKEQPSNNQVTGKEQPSNTDKNVKNVKNDKNKDISPLVLDLKNVKRMDQPLTQEQGEKLIDEYGERSVKDILMRMENWKPLNRKNKSAYLTANNWLSKDKPKNGQNYEKTTIEHGKSVSERVDRAFD